MDHACLALTDDQQLELYFEDILVNVDESDILQKWNSAVSHLDITSEVLSMFRLKIYFKCWRETDMKTVN